MILLALPTALAAPPERDEALAVYVCGQTNPSDYASFALRFRVDAATHPVRLVGATLVDRATHETSARTGAPARVPDWDLEDLDAWRIGRDPGGTVYLLRVPRGDLDQTVGVQVVQVFGGGRAEWVSEFSCTRR
jgi:hypothetical protein